ncbi:hypothetical protein A3H26_04135 [candidate division WWE3 bacterium RIFCSPLOWO2_12_FULL_36_10]|uniref:Uncharacterized protein n=1 Tax=candidate division WWE3 bacterium RIFCSPLOWO2_12_FULL_36_10 TaxID=1802630 RepID=A0A1F4VJ09_UNCKA|nr:MAG: hypothetical protein A3H26_04135 [candidate division WWE3 bacterium RIFCSPLOWO2_12_FULL_36_10]
MDNKSHSLLKLTLIYFFLSIFFLLFFQFSLVIAIFSVLPVDIKIFLINVFKDLSSLYLIKNPPSFFQPFFTFILMELPFVLLSFATSYLLFRNKCEKKYHLLAATFSLLGILILGSFTVIKPMNVGEHKFPGFFSVQISLREFRCSNLPKQSIFNWTYPSNGQTNASIHSPVVVNLKNGVRISSSCDTTYINGRYANSSKMLGGFPGSNIPLVPDGSNTVSELNYLSNADLDEIKKFVSAGSWDNNAIIKVTCNYIKSGCSGNESFSFTTGEE